MEQREVVKLISGSGALGGFAGWLFSFAIGPMPRLGVTDVPESLVIILSVLAWTVLGAVAAFIFTVIAANTDRTDKVRLAGLSLLAGMFWLPVISGAKTFVDQQVAESTREKAQAALARANELLAQADDLSGEQKAAAIAGSQTELRRARELAERLDSATLTAEIASLSEPMIDSLPPTRDFDRSIQITSGVLQLCSDQTQVGECLESIREIPPVANSDIDPTSGNKEG